MNTKILLGIYDLYVVRYINIKDDNLCQFNDYTVMVNDRPEMFV